VNPKCSGYFVEPVSLLLPFISLSVTHRSRVA
jgi:hypothetical protein